MERLPVIGITMGDPAGIGPEIILKLHKEEELVTSFRFFVLGDQNILKATSKRINLPLKINLISDLEETENKPGLINLFNLSNLSKDTIKIGGPDKDCGKFEAFYIEKAVKMAKDNLIDAIVTCPINKKSLNLAGYNFPGHTELLAQLTGSTEVGMMLAGEKLKVILVTTHCSLKNVSNYLNKDKILSIIRLASHELKSLFGISSPRIGVAALNPHAGEDGLFGDEERRIIKPAVEESKKEGIRASGPHPSDTLFYFATQGKYDAIICMYHDQGLIPLKLLHFFDGVNITLGLPIIRTSVDHGTAYDIVGKGIANHQSLIAAVKWAGKLVELKFKSFK
jgi:4-hydroxythreonine-4-phosphate dehydrogenase